MLDGDQSGSHCAFLCCMSCMRVRASTPLPMLQRSKGIYSAVCAIAEKRLQLCCSTNSGVKMSSLLCKWSRVASSAAHAVVEYRALLWHICSSTVKWSSLLHVQQWIDRHWSHL